MLEQSLARKILFRGLLWLMKRAFLAVCRKEIRQGGEGPNTQSRGSGEVAVFPAIEKIVGGPQKPCPVHTIGEGGQAAQAFPDFSTCIVRAIGKGQILGA